MGRMKIGSLFSGYGGLDMGVKAAIGGDVAWHVEFDPAPSKILAHHHPDVPNYGDIRDVDWDAVEPVDVLTGGFPCQDVSLAGRRAGITTGTRSGLWSEFAHAIDVLRPGLVVIENVRGLLSATADGAVESDPWGVGDGATRPVVNAFGVVLGDLVSLGYDARWCGVRAADAGAPHGRFRVFCVAYPAGARRGGRENARASRGDAGAHGGRRVELERGSSERTRAASADTGSAGRREGDRTSGVGAEGEDRSGVVDEHRPRPSGPEWGGSVDAAADQADAREALRDMWGGYGAEAIQRSTRGSDPLSIQEELFAGMRKHEGDSHEGHAPLACEETSLATVRGVRNHDGSARTPRRPESSEQRPGESTDAVRESPPETALAGGQGEASCGCAAWGQYGPAIHRWEGVLGRAAVAPTEPTGRDGSHRLSARAVEFMMGLPDGHVTSVGLTRNEQLKALGNGVVPQQAELAIRTLLEVS